MRGQDIAARAVRHPVLGITRAGTASPLRPAIWRPSVRMFPEAYRARACGTCSPTSSQGNEVATRAGSASADTVLGHSREVPSPGRPGGPNRVESPKAPSTVVQHRLAKHTRTATEAVRCGQSGGRDGTIIRRRPALARAGVTNQGWVGNPARTSRPWRRLACRTGGGGATGGCSACRATARIQPMNADAIRANPLAANPAPMPMERQRAASRVGRWPAVWCNVWKTARPEWRATV